MELKENEIANMAKFVENMNFTYENLVKFATEHSHHVVIIAVLKKGQLKPPDIFNVCEQQSFDISVVTEAIRHLEKEEDLMSMCEKTGHNIDVVITAIKTNLVKCENNCILLCEKTFFDDIVIGMVVDQNKK
jgi:hypothetical protein